MLRSLPNLLTLSRIPLLFLVVALDHLPFRGSSSAALAVFVVAALTDWADGALARRLGVISNFGKLMDALTDKVLTTGMFVALLVLGHLPQWALLGVLLILAREFLVTGLRLVAASRGLVLAAESAGKVKTVTQLVAIILLLVAPVVGDDLGPWLPEGWGALGAFGIEFLGTIAFALATVLTVTSGIAYLIRHADMLKE